MTPGLARLAGLAALAACVLAPAAARAQYRPLAEPEPQGKKGTWVKLGLAHWQGDIFSKSSLTQWDVELFGADYDLTSASFEADTFLGRGLVVPGFSLGYRKDAVRERESGHMLSAAAFVGLDLKLVMLKAGGGAEWGVPSMRFDQTVFDHGVDGTVRYRHTYPIRNSQVPVGARTNGALYPFAVASVVTRPGPFLFEIGMRVNLTEFRFDDYEVRPGDHVTRAFSQQRVKMPLLFANVGIKFL